MLISGLVVYGSIVIFLSGHSLPVSWRNFLYLNLTAAFKFAGTQNASNRAQLIRHSITFFDHFSFLQNAAVAKTLVSPIHNFHILIYSTKQWGFFIVFQFSCLLLLREGCIYNLDWGTNLTSLLSLRTYKGTSLLLQNLESPLLNCFEILPDLMETLCWIAILHTFVFFLHKCIY